MASFFLTLTIVAICAALSFSAITRAQPRPAWRIGVIHVHDCRELNEAHIRPLLDAGLRADAEHEALAIDVEVVCVGETELLLSLSTRGGAPRVVDLSDVPTRLRARLTALAIAELLLVASVQDAAPAIVDLSAAPIAATDSAPVPPTSHAAEVAHSASPRASRDDAGPSTQGLVRRIRGALLRAPRTEGARVPLFVPVVRGSMRAFLFGRAVLWGGDLLLRIGPVGVGAHASAGTASRDDLGTLTPSLLLGVAELAVVGVDAGALDMRLSTRVSAGRAAINAVATDRNSRASSLAAPFVEGALVLSAALVWGAFAYNLDLALGYAAGLVAQSDSLVALALDGATLSVALGVEVLP